MSTDGKGRAFDQLQATNTAFPRRTMLRAASVAASASVLGCGRPAQAQSPPATKDDETNGKPTNTSVGGPAVVQPLPFSPDRLRGLSEKLIVSHHDNNYAGAVKKFNAVDAQLSAAGSDVKGFVLGALQAKRLAFENSVILHELYFENLGGSGELGSETRKAISEHFGSVANFEKRFFEVGQSLAGGSGWTLLSYHLHHRRLSIDIAGDHSQTCAGSVVLLALDMYEHSYHMDYGTAAARYIEAFMNNVEGEVVERRLLRAEKIAQLT